MVSMWLFALAAASVIAGLIFQCSCEEHTIRQSSNNCRNFGNYEFKCKSGDCINRTLLCNDEINCADGSDESDDICKNRSVRAAEGGCVLPEYPPNGRYVLGGCNPPSCQANPGSRMDAALLTFTCEAGYTLNGSSLVLCDLKWLSPFPSCVAGNVAIQCPSLVSSAHLIRCTNGGREVRCDQPLQPFTKATAKCNNFYEPKYDTESSEITCNEDGELSEPLLSCEPKCGEFNFTASSSPTDGGKSINLPWFAAVLKKDEDGSWQYACSSSIISTRVVVSAGHCVWNEFEEKLVSPENFAIVVGKYEHGPKETPSKIVQEILVQKIYVPERFRGNKLRFENDISLLYLEKDIIINEFIRPVCIDYLDSYSPYFIPGKLGIVGSVGEPIDKTYKVRVVSMPIVKFEDCFNNVPLDFQSYLTKDKFCAGYIKSKTVCIGDSGSGFSNQFKDGRWYLTGVLSVGVSPSNGESCDINFYKGFSRVSLFLDFINRILYPPIFIPANPVLIPTCGKYAFECNSGECINKSYLCDGIKHCPDGSDETYEKCHLFECPETTFQCQYGACIDKKFLCNGIRECEDGSDEEFCSAPTMNHTSCFCLPSSGCELPTQPKNGFYTVFGSKTTNQPLPGSIVPGGILLNFSCNPGFVLYGPPLLACNGNWTSESPSCNPVLCDPLENPSREIECIFNREDVDCVTRPVKPGTRANIRCKINYETIPGLQNYDMLCESNGKWNRELHSCIAKCGIPNPRGVPFIGSGHVSQLAEFPWHIGFYKQLENGTVIPSCGGSIVSPRVVVSAAHCFWKNAKVDFKEYKTVAGKYYYAWENKTKYVQHLQIQEVFLPENYKGPGRNYANDVAIVVLKYQIQINEAVRPVCVDYDRTYLRYFSPVGTIGNVTGWGLNEKQEFNEALHVANLPYVDNDECERNSPEHFHALLTNDKFCAGNINKTTACPGDSGGGYTVRFRDGRSYLVGIVSAGPTELCSVFPYVAFTNVFYHLDFIREYVYKYL